MRTLPNTIHKDKLKMDERPKRTEIIKLLEENIGRTLDDSNKDFLGHINHTIKLKKKMIGLIRINNFCFCMMKGKL